MPFELASPAGLWLLALVPPLVVLYILKVRRTRVTVSSTWLWSAAQRDLMARSPFRRLIAQVPLLLELTALVALALALARPTTRGASIAGDHVAIVLDTSASMNARGADGAARIELARRAAHRIVASLGPGADSLVVAAGREARLVSPLERDRKRLRDAIDGVAASEAEGDLGRAVALASERLRSLPGDSRLVVITDGALAQPDALTGVTLPLDVLRVGEPFENLALTRLDVRRGTDPATRREQVQVFAVVTSHAATRRETYVTLRQRNVGSPLASRQLALEPGEQAPVLLTFEPAPTDAGTGLVVELAPGDALPADDRAYARVPHGERLPVVLAPPDGSPWLRRALAADPSVELGGARLEELARAPVPPDALVVVAGACPAVLPGADFVVVNPPPGRCLTVEVGAPLDRPAVTSWKEADPRLRFLTLDGVAFSEARELRTDGPNEVLVRAREGALITDVSVPGRTGTLLGFEPGQTSWPLKASFVLFVRNVVELARAHRARGLTGPARTGEPLQVRVPYDVTEVEVTGPTEVTAPLSAREGLAVVPDVDRAGFYHLAWRGARPGSVLATANLASERESDTRWREIAVSGTASAQVSSGEVVEAVTDWSYLLGALALLLLLADVAWLGRAPRQLAPPAPRAPERLAREATR
ncbi:MAG: BatA and WFA domain-containing protein [Polyangiaceae bacterium]|nr:BatA and WFA domain-containing protein [Polyangiaceae bacterium]